MSNAKLEAHEAKHRRLAMELFDKVGNLELSTDIAVNADMFLDLTKLLKTLQWHLWEAGYGTRLLEMQSEVIGKYDTPAYFATIHLAQTNDVENDVSAEELARVLLEECTRYVMPENGWPEQNDPRSQSLKREIDVEYVAAMQVHWLRMGRELLGRNELEAAMPTPPTSLQQSIWKALEGRALKVDELAHACHVDRSRLYGNRNKTGGLNEMKKAGCVKHTNGVGCYRPDAPPPMLVNKRATN